MTTLEEFNEFVEREMAARGEYTSCAFRYPDHLIPLVNELVQSSVRLSGPELALLGGAVAVPAAGAVSTSIQGEDPTGAARRTRRHVVGRATKVLAAAASIIALGFVTKPQLAFAMDCSCVGATYFGSCACRFLAPDTFCGCVYKWAWRYTQVYSHDTLGGCDVYCQTIQGAYGGMSGWQCCV